MSNPAVKKPSAVEARIGEQAAMQPLSGIARVDESGAVNGNGHGGFIRQEETKKPSKTIKHWN